MRSCSKIRLLTLATLAAIAVAGCSSNSISPATSTPGAGGSSAAGSAMGSSAAARATAHNGKITINTTDQLMFAPSMVATGVGTLTVTLTNNGSYPHNLSVPALHVTSPTVSGGPGSTSTTVTLRFTKPGRYPFTCTYHASAGMRGEFIVTR